MRLAKLSALIYVLIGLYVCFPELFLTLAYAATSTAPAPLGLDWQTLFAPVLIGLIPVLVNFMKKAIPPSMSWLVPILAMVLGPVADLISQKATGVGVGPAAAAGLGLAGVGLREIVNQLKQAAAPTP